jgi:hypothetical protein
MLGKLLLSFALILSISPSFAGTAVLVEEDGVPIEPLSQRSTRKEIYQGQEFASNYELREKRRVGVGAQFAGAGGVYGFFAELNINPSNSASFGFGGGPGYSSIFGSWKYLLSENRFSPYGGLGFAHWYDATGASEGKQQSNPYFLNSQFLTTKERETGRFQVDLLTGQIGIQYHVLKGPFAGISFFSEIDVMLRLTKVAMAPTGTVGSAYYF